MEKAPFDLIVVGGGPAGSAAALYAKRKGLKTLLLDKARFPRDKTCGDALSGKSVEVLRELGLYEEVRSLSGTAIRRIVFFSPGRIGLEIDLGRHVLRSSLTGETLPLEGFVVRRRLFDAFLFSEAKAQVDQCIEGFAVRDLLWEGGQVCGVRGRRRNGEEEEFQGRVVLGCDGFGSVVARRAGLYQRDERHWMVALRQYYQGVDGLADQIELHFVDEVLPGYFWIFPAGEGWANVGIGMDYRDLKERNVDLREALQEMVRAPDFRDRFVRARPLGKPAGWNLPVGSGRRRIHADGVLLLGDAAGLIDPFTGEGVGNALYSARLAVECATEAREAGDFSASFLRRYEERIWDTLGEELRVSARLHELSRRRWLMNWVIRKASRNPRIQELIGGMMANAVPRRRLTSPIFYLRLLLG